MSNTSLASIGDLALHHGGVLRDARLANGMALAAENPGQAYRLEYDHRGGLSLRLHWESAADPLGRDPQLVASMLQGAMVGVSRRMLESGAAEKQFEGLRRELIAMACAYVEACSALVSVEGGSQVVGWNELRTVTKRMP